AGGGARALRSRAGAGARLHRPPRRPIGPAARRQGSWPQDGRQPARTVRIAGGDARGRAIRGAGGGIADVPANGASRRLCPPPSPAARPPQGARRHRPTGTPPPRGRAGRLPRPPPLAPPRPPSPGPPPPPAPPPPIRPTAAPRPPPPPPPPGRPHATCRPST